MRLPVAAALAALLALPACGGPAPITTAAPPSTSAPAPSAEPSAPPEPAPAPVEPAAVWAVGASPLPLRPDGFGQVLPTPEVLRDRRLPTVDRLPPPADGFAATVDAVPPDVRARMGATWSEDCPVALEDLRYLTVSFVGFDDRPHTGELVVAASVADDVVEVFRQLFEARFPVEEMRLPTTADLEAAPTGDGNNTAGYVCRRARGQTRWSAHALGLAVDVNPFHNPLVKRDLVLPELAGAYADRTDVRPGMHVAGGPAVRAFRSVGWTWGGDWRSSKDWMHFSATGD
ncbi:MAG TPA: M15 family metallopeptidase [Mycobacteriales bacterium]|nr:M15 family metallopeptidase [Mycobacteriales bacterium]